MDILNFILDPRSDFLGHTLSYLQICAISIAGAVIIGVILGAAVSGNSLLAFIAVNLSGLLRAIPVIATLIVFVPFFGLGLKPTLIALIIVGIPPVLLNTYTGIRGVDPAMIDSAKGMGMTTWQIATKIQTPLVLPLVAAGVRTTAVQIVATATLAAFIGAGATVITSSMALPYSIIQNSLQVHSRWRFSPSSSRCLWVGSNAE